MKQRQLPTILHISLYSFSDGVSCTQLLIGQMNTFCWFLKLNIFRIFFIFYAEVKADLRSELLNGYSRFALPPDAPITVTVDLDFYQLIDFDVAAESVYGLFWQTNTWNDQRLAWQKNNTEQGRLILIEICQRKSSVHILNWTEFAHLLFSFEGECFCNNLFQTRIYDPRITYCVSVLCTSALTARDETRRKILVRMPSTNGCIVDALFR